MGKSKAAAMIKLICSRFARRSITLRSVRPRIESLKNGYESWEMPSLNEGAIVLAVKDAKSVMIVSFWCFIHQYSLGVRAVLQTIEQWQPDELEEEEEVAPFVTAVASVSNV